MRILVFLTFFGIGSGVVHAQTSGSQDSATSGALRPRWGSYLIQTFPSPANSAQKITIQFYNHRDETLMCRVYDMANHLILDLWPKQFMTHGLHSKHVEAYTLTAGTYFIRLTTFTASDAEDVVDNARFIVVH